jgi:hypothetical protein
MSQSNNDAAVRTLALRLRDRRAKAPAPTTPTPQPRIAAPRFIDPVLIEEYDPPTGSINHASYQTYNLPSDVPRGAYAVILESEWAQDQPDAGDVDTHLRIRAAAGEPEYLLSRGRAALSEQIAGANQGIFPFDTSAMSIQYRVEAPGFNDGWALRLIGYVG